MDNPITIWKLNPTGNHHFKVEQLTIEPPPVSLNSASKRIPGGIYTTFRTYNHGRQILPLEYQLRRLEASARLVNIPVTLDRQSIRDVLVQSLQRFSNEDSRIRLTIDTNEKPGTLYLAVEKLRTPPTTEYQNGVFVVTYPFQRENPHAKQTTFLAVAEKVKSELPPGANEALLLAKDGQILEGLSSNFFGVKDGEVWTAGDAVLPGITRSLVIRAAGQENIQVHLKGILVTEIPDLEEAFLTSSSRSILPVRQIDQTQVGSGEPGPVTKRLMEAYWREINSRLIEI
jgi:branched-chain amino acid aminotransferase